jgi:hypothetical protein
MEVTARSIKQKTMFLQQAFELLAKCGFSVNKHLSKRRKAPYHSSLVTPCVEWQGSTGK